MFLILWTCGLFYAKTIYLPVMDHGHFTLNLNGQRAISQKHQKHGKIHVGIQAKYTSECPLYNSQRTPVTGPVTNVWAFVLSKPFSVTPARCPVIPFNSDTNGIW